MTAKTTREFIENWRPAAQKPPKRTRTTRPTHINTVTCSRCLGARVVMFQWFGEQQCPACEGTGESDE